MSQYPSIAAGQRVTAALLLSMLPLEAVKPAVTARTSTTTLAVDPDLALTIPRAGTWSFDVWLNYTGGTLGSSDLKLSMQYSGTSSFGVWGVNGINTTATSQITANGNAVGTNTLTVGTSGGTFYTADIHGQITVSTTGTLALYWAQNTSSATATNLRQGSYLRLKQISD